ncbi:MAG: YitT family protein [Clostridiaceae bacterium]
MNNVLNKYRGILDTIIIIFGCFIASIGVNMFLVHARLLSGGVAGIGLIIQYTTSFKAGFTVFLINIPLFIISYFKLSKSFTFYSAIGMLSQSFFLVLTENFNGIINLNDTLLYCIYGGVLCGIGYGLVFSRNASTGGVDIIVMLIRKFYTGDIGKVSFIVNLIIVSIGGFLLGLPKALYTLLSIYIQGLIVDKVVKGLNRRQLMLIITEEDENIKGYIMNHLHRGVTILPAEGGYTSQKKKLLYCIVSTGQMIELRRAILSLDASAFMSIIDVSEVKGKGFINI